MKMMDRMCVLFRLILGVIFIYAGGKKLFDPVVFATLIEVYGLIPDILIFPVAVLLPIFEVIGGIGILLDIKGSLSLISGLLILFLLILGYGINLGIDVNCGCFGIGDPEIRAFHGLKYVFFRDLFMMAGVFYIYLWKRFQKNKSRKQFVTTAS